MPLNIKNDEVERLVAEVAGMTGETKTEAVRRALRDRRDRLALERSGADRAERLRRFLDSEVRRVIPEGERGRRLSRKEEDAVLGYGPAGV